jgi:DNA-binding NtrC family response regulator
VNTKSHLIALDGDDAVLKTISKFAGPFFNVLITRDPRKFLAWVEHYPDTSVVVTEHVLRTAHGVSLLESCRTMRPDARRVLLTTYHDLASIVAGLHSGAIERLIPKPFSPAELLAAILPKDVILSIASKRASA